MKYRPILFKDEMVRAILDGRKTQTRRVVKTQPMNGWAFEKPPVFGRITSKHPKQNKFGAFIRRGLGTDFPEAGLIACPHGQPGDRLWVREAFRLCAEADETKPSDTDEAYRVWYEADAPHQLGFGKLRPSMFMTRWASRITLEITGVRVERLQDISEADARQEGIYSDRVIVSTNCHSGHHTEVHDDRYFFGNEPHEGFECAIEAFAELWESINGPSSWDANPFVWVVEFRRVQS